MTIHPLESCPILLPVEIVSFGYGHGPAPVGHAVIDVRHHFKDPHINPVLRFLTARDEAVMQTVMDTPGVEDLVRAIADMAHAFGRGPTPGTITIALGCVGGRHRSAAVAIAVAHVLDAEGFQVALAHRDIDRPVINRPTAG